MSLIPAAWASIDEVSKRVGTLQRKYAANPRVNRIEHRIGSDWSGEPAIFLDVILVPDRPVDDMLKNLASDLRLDLLRIIHSEDIGLHSYLNFYKQELTGCSLTSPKNFSTTLLFW